MPVELRITGENATDILIQLHEFGHIAQTVLEGGQKAMPATTTQTLEEMFRDQERGEEKAPEVEATPAVEPAKRKGGRPRKAAAAVPTPEPEEVPAPEGEPEPPEPEVTPAPPEETTAGDDLLGDLGTVPVPSDTGGASLLDDEPAQEQEQGTSPGGEKLKADLTLAISMLSRAYKDDKGRPLVLAVRKKYGVGKFGEIPVEKGSELLADAQQVENGMTA